MRPVRTLATLATLCCCASAHAEHFQFQVDLTGTYSVGGTEGCYPPDFNQSACPRDGTRTATFSFDTPTSQDGAFLIAGSWGEITDFQIDLGWLTPGDLYGGVNLAGGLPNGTVETLDGLEVFSFDWATRSATYDYDYLDHNPWGRFSGKLSAVPEPRGDFAALLGLCAIAALARRRKGQASPQAAKSGFSNPGLA
jgi:hypothetical protein